MRHKRRIRRWRSSLSEMLVQLLLQACALRLRRRRFNLYLYPRVNKQFSHLMGMDLKLKISKLQEESIQDVMQLYFAGVVARKFYLGVGGASVLPKKTVLEIAAALL